MARKFSLPDLGEGIQEAEVLEILVSVGDQVEEDEPILVVETDKASVEIPSPFEGTVEAIEVEPGQLISVGDVLLRFDGEGPAGETAEEDQGPEQEPEPEEEPAADQRESQEVESGTSGGDLPVPASPATRKRARELGLDLSQVEGSGPSGRVTRQDVEQHAEAAKKTAAAEPKSEAKPAQDTSELSKVTSDLSPAGVGIPDLPDFESWGPIERQPVQSVRRSIAQKMSQAWSQIPHVSHRDEVDVTELNQLYQEYKEGVKEKGGNLTLTLFVIKAVVSALKEFPRFNSSLDAESGELILKHYFHIGVAVDTDRGLIVPVIRDVDEKSITELAVELQDLADRTREREIGLEDLQGGSFTITNIGFLGGTDFTPIINYPQAAILGMAQARWQPVVNTEMEIEPRYILPLIVTFDHRIVDGADAVRFMNKIIEILNEPEKLLLEI